MIVASTSTLYGQRPLEYLLNELKSVFAERNIESLLFIPFARPGGITHDQYTTKIQKALSTLNIEVTGIHKADDATKAIENAKAIFTGGGNTFVLVKQLHDRKLMQPLREAIYSGTFYLGTSAGSNICGLTMQTTNDMPILKPASFKTTGVLGYNINAHYQDPTEGNQHMGETREQRINEFHTYNSVPVLGLREGSYIRVKGTEEILKGPHSARVFKAGAEPTEVQPDTDVSFLK